MNNGANQKLDVASLVSRIEVIEERQNITAKYAARVKRQLDELTEQFKVLQQHQDAIAPAAIEPTSELVVNPAEVAVKVDLIETNQLEETDTAAQEENSTGFTDEEFKTERMMWLVNRIYTGEEPNQEIPISAEEFLQQYNEKQRNFTGINLTGVNLSEKSLSHVNLRGANLSGADLRKANLYQVNLSEANLSGAILNAVNLSQYANLSRANLSKANLSRSNLRTAKLMKADLSYANLSNANLLGANLNGAIMPDSTTEDLSNTQIQLNKTTFAPGEEIRVSFIALPTNTSNSWIGIIPSQIPHGSQNVNGLYDISYQSLHGRTSGELIFTAPTQTGSYDFRMHDNGKEITSTSFTVL